MLKKMISLIVLITVSVNLCGCVALIAGAAGGAGTAAWLSGKLVQEVNAPFDKAIDAAQSGLESLNLDVTKLTKKERSAQVMSKYVEDETIWIDIHKISRSRSRIEVRVDVLDKEAARKVLDKILKHL